MARDPHAAREALHHSVRSSPQYRWAAQITRQCAIAARALRPTPAPSDDFQADSACTLSPAVRSDRFAHVDIQHPSQHPSRRQVLRLPVQRRRHTVATSLHLRAASCGHRGWPAPVQCRRPAGRRTDRPCHASLRHPCRCRTPDLEALMATGTLTNDVEISVDEGGAGA